MGGSSLAPEVFRLSYGTRRAGCACTCSTRPSRCRSPPSRPRSTSRRRCSSSPPSRAARSRRSRCSSTSTGCRATARTSCSITDPGSSLLELAEEHGFRRAFQNDPEIGGRYSALSYFGLVPAALAGIDVRPLLEGAQVAAQACSDFENPEHNAGLWLGLALGELARAGRDKLTFVVDDPIASFGVWVEQLVAESTGKQGRGILPIADEPLLRRRGLRPRPRLPPPPQHRRAGRRARRGASRRSPRPGTRR